MAEGSGLLNRPTGNTCSGGSNPPLSASVSLWAGVHGVSALVGLSVWAFSERVEKPVEHEGQLLARDGSVWQKVHVPNPIVGVEPVEWLDPACGPVGVRHVEEADAYFVRREEAFGSRQDSR